MSDGLDPDLRSRMGPDATPEHIRATAELVRAYGERSHTRFDLGVWLLLTVIVLLVFRCNDVTLWPLPQRRVCAEVTP